MHLLLFGLVPDGATAPPQPPRFAGVGPRAAATLIDGVIGFIAFGVPIIFALGKKTTTVTTTGNTTTTHSISDPKWFALWAALAIAYSILFESWLGATPGKLMVGLRVRSSDGEPCGFGPVVVRNLMRLVDAFPYVLPYLAGAVSIWTDGDSLSRRLGDRVAGTVVVRR